MSTLIVNGASVVPSAVVLGGLENWEEVLSPGNYPKMTADRDRGAKFIRAFKIHADELSYFAFEALGGSGTLPGVHPAYTAMRVENLDAEPFAGDNAIGFRQRSEGFTEPIYFLIIVTYSPMSFKVPGGDPGETPEPGGEDLYDGSINVSSEVVLTESASFKWEGDSVRIPEHMQLPIIISIVDREINIPRVNSIPWAAIRACVSTVNIATYMGVPAESMLYLGAGVRFKRLFDGSMNWGLTHKFKEKTLNTVLDGRVGWNHAFRASDGRWKRTEPLFYKKTNMAALIPGVS